MRNPCTLTYMVSVTMYRMDYIPCCAARILVASAMRREYDTSKGRLRCLLLPMELCWSHRPEGDPMNERTLRIGRLSWL